MPSSVKHNSRTDPKEKEKDQEEEDSSEVDGRQAVESSGEKAQPEGKKKKRSGFRDRKVEIVLCQTAGVVQ